MENSGDSRPSSGNPTALELSIVCLGLAVLITGAAWWFFRNNYILYWGDAASHLNIARSVLDSRTPGYQQLGQVWLPLLHVICLPFVRNAFLWSSGLAGTIPVAACFVFAGTCLFWTARIIYGDRTAAVAVLACFALNPNVLYLGSIPMTEMVFFAGLSLFLLSFALFRRQNRGIFVALAICASWIMSLTRYDGWFLAPFVAVWFGFAAKKHRWRTLLVIAAFVSLAPLYWIAHNWYQTGNALDFYNGPYSAKAIQGGRPYPGFGNWLVALLYYAAAGQLCAGWPLLLIGIAGLWYAKRSRASAPTCFLLLTPLFYVWSIHSSGNPIFVPKLYPFSYYNTRYGMAVVFLAAFASGALALQLSARHRAAMALLIPAIAFVPWLFTPAPQHWICWKESQMNSVSRRAWTIAAADYLRVHYRSGDGILTESGSGDLIGILCQDRIPIREALHIGNGPPWRIASRRPDLSHSTAWALAQHGDDISRTLSGDPQHTYRLTYEIRVKDAPTVEIYRRAAAEPL